MLGLPSVCGTLPNSREPRGIRLLTLFGAAGEKNDQPVAIATKIDPIARPEIEPVLQNALADALDVGKIAKSDARQAHGDLCGSNSIKPGEPERKRAFPGLFQIFDDVHCRW